MPKIDVVLTPALWSIHDATDKMVVVIDIFRATSTICAALHFGANSVLPIREADETLTYSQQGYLTAGERNGKALEAFDFGNSPVLIQNDILRGVKLALTTTNGTKCFELAKHANCHQVLSGSFMNIQATANYLKAQSKDIVLLCAGWKDHFNLEDSLFAGALVTILADDFEIDTDASLLCKNLYHCAQELGFHEFLKQSSHYKRLSQYDASGDMELCLKHDLYHQVVILKDNHLVLLAD